MVTKISKSNIGVIKMDFAVNFAVLKSVLNKSHSLERNNEKNIASRILPFWPTFAEASDFKCGCAKILAYCGPTHKILEIFDVLAQIWFVISKAEIGI